MKRRIFSIVSCIVGFCFLLTISVIDVKASNEESTWVDGSYLTTDDYSEGHTPTLTRGQYLMTGECSISKAGLTRVYAYASTTANRKVNYMTTIVYIDQYNETLEKWGQVYAWSDEAENDYYMSLSKSVSVERGYYYRVRARHIAGDEYPYDETASVTNGIYLP